jgi:hypothetical protein
MDDDGSVEVAGWGAGVDAVTLAVSAAVLVTVCGAMCRKVRQLAAAPP